jgi:cytochrome o ubiquinol oxidase operon protein cyoD
LDEGKRRETWSYLIGYVLALALTGVAFAAVRWPHFAATTTLAIVFGLALVQVVVHFRCFLHISLVKSSRDDLQLVLFSTLIVVLMVSGTVVILMNLRQRMM